MSTTFITFLICFLMPSAAIGCVLLGFKLLDLLIGLVEWLHGVTAKQIFDSILIWFLELIFGKIWYFW